MRTRLFSQRGQTWTIVLIVLAAAFAGGVWYWRAHRKSSMEFQTASATRGNITQAVTATGTLNPVLNVQVGSQISGNIKKLFADFNTPVKKDQTVALIDPGIYEAAVAQAEGDVSSAQAALELAQVNEKRTRELREQNATPQSNLDTAVANLHQAEAILKIKQAALQKAKVDLEHCTITSPIDGIVISRSVDVGQTVAASLSAPVIFTIANDLTKMQIDSNVAEADVGNVKVGQDVDFTVDAFPTRTFHGTVKQVRNAPITVQNVVTYDTVIEVTNDELLLKPGMTANVSIIISQKENVVRVSNAALRFRMPEGVAGTPTPEPTAAPTPRVSKRATGTKGDRRPARSIWLMRDGKPVQVPIKTGISDGIYTEIVEGVNEGDTVIVGAINPAAPTPAPSGPFGGGPRFR